MKNTAYMIIGMIILILLFGFLSYKIFYEVYEIKNCDEDFLKDYEQAINERNIQFCKEEFYNRGYLGHSEPACRVNNSEIISIDICMIKIIQHSQDILLCKEFYSITECFSEIVGLLDNPSLCDTLDFDTKLQCVEYITGNAT